MKNQYVLIITSLFFVSTIFGSEKNNNNNQNFNNSFVFVTKLHSEIFIEETEQEAKEKQHIEMVPLHQNLKRQEEIKSVIKPIIDTYPYLKTDRLLYSAILHIYRNPFSTRLKYQSPYEKACAQSVLWSVGHKLIQQDNKKITEKEKKEIQDPLYALHDHMIVQDKK